MLLNAMRQNEVMKQLAAWAAMLAVPTAIAGIYGMNFTIHAASSTGSTAISLTMVLIAIICGFLYWRFHKSGWLLTRSRRWTRGDATPRTI